VSTLFGLLHVGQKGMHAHSYAVGVTAQNIQNANTEGYTRRDVRLSPTAPPPPYGGGVEVDGARRIRDDFLEKRVLGATSQLGAAEGRRDAVRILDFALQDSASGLGMALDDFEAAIGEWQASPAERSTRLQLLSTVERLGAAFSGAATRLEQARADIDDQIESTIADMNVDLAQIAELGRQIARYENSTGEEAADLRDQRDQMLRDLSEDVPIVLVEDEVGLNVLLAGGVDLVSSDGQAATLKTDIDPVTGNVQILRTQAGMDVDVTSKIDEGKLGGQIEARDRDLAGSVAALDQLAYDLANAYNDVHTTGFGLDGVTGRNLFEPPAAVAGAASSLALAAELVDQPDRLAGATDASLVDGDNRNILALSGLADTRFAAGGTRTAQEALADVMVSGGVAVRSAELDVEVATGVEAQLEALRSSVSGVSTDEEVINLDKFQRGYQASLRVVSVADQMLQELLALAR
jgi:flagellar hook-associated protein 1 FlgK